MRLFEPLSEVANTQNTIRFKLPVNPVSQTLNIIKNFTNAHHAKTFTSTGSNKKFELENDILDKMTNYKFCALSIEQPKHQKLLSDFLDEMRFDINYIKHVGINRTRDKNLERLFNSPAIRAGFLKKI